MLFTTHKNTEIDISFVILTWNSINHINRCINSYSAELAKERLHTQFLIVDNGSSDSTVNEIENKIFANLPFFCEGKLFRLHKNNGTTISRNIALRAAMGKYVVVCDSDTEYQSGVWKEAINYLKNNIDVGILAPCLRYPDGIIQNSVKKFPTATDKLMKLGKIFFGFNAGKSDFYADFPWEKIRSVDTAISACWIFKRELLYQVGYLDEKIYYSPEDIDYCVRVWENKKKIIFYPMLTILHHTQQISHNSPFSRQSISHFLGLIYYFRKHNYFFSRKKLLSRLKNDTYHDFK